ncbi:MAG: Ig-like domain-containing protein, partial [Bryobacteraceae bacterium]
MRNVRRFLAAIIFFSIAAGSQAQSISPASVTLKPSRTQQFSVTNAYRNAYSWSIDPSSTGSISATGLYTAPATITAPSTVTIFATYVAAPTRPALSATVTLMPQVSISISPTWIAMTNGQSATFSATVTGATDTAVSWGMPTVGSVTDGLYTVPMSLTTPQTITLTVYSQLDSTRTATATIALTPTIAVALNATSTSLTAGQSTSLNATVTGSTNTGVTWALSPQVGTISNGVYTAPSPIPSAQSVMVAATSQVARGATAGVELSLVPLSIAVTPTSKTLTSGQSATFTASVTGSSNTAVNWALTPAVGSIVNGVYTAPASIASAQTVTVLATSAADPTKTARAAISLTPPAPAVSISVTPTRASLTGGQAATFAATVTGSSNLAVNWTLSPAVGTLTNGVYKAPALISLQQTVTVAASSAADPTKIAAASITLIPSVSVSVAPTTASLSAGQSQQFSASLSGTTNPNVTWSMSPSVGSLGDGLYRAPATINSHQTITLIAKSLADPIKTGSATITLVPTVGIALTPSSISLTGGQSTQFNVSIGGVPSTAVTWALAPSVGTITNGVYTAPVTISALQTIVLTVASIANPAQTATAYITLTASTGSGTSVSPSIASLSPSGTQQFTASGLGTNPVWT